MQILKIAMIVFMSIINMGLCDVNKLKECESVLASDKIFENSPNYYIIKEMSEIPIPDTIVIYYNNEIKEFSSDSEVFKNIIKMNTSRTGSMHDTFTTIDLEYTKKNNNILIEYKYIDRESSVYFSLLREDSLNDYMGVYVCVIKFPEFRAQGIYNGLDNFPELVKYIEEIF